MVSGFLTSPFDHMRIESAVARPMRSWSKSLTSSTYSPSPLETICTPALVLLVGAALRTGEVDAELLGGTEDVLVELPHLDLLACRGEDLHVQTERLHLLDEHLEGLRDARFGDVLALDDGLIDLDPAEDVVGLDGEQLLQGVGGAVGLEGPHLHLAEALAAELCLPAQRLLGDHRVRPRRASVDLVVDEVEQLHDVDVADGDGPVVGITGAPVVELGLAVDGDETIAVGRLGVQLL